MPPNADMHDDARKPHAVRNPRPFRQQKGAGSVFPVEVVRNNSTHQYYRATRTYEIFDQKFRKTVQAKTAKLAVEKLERVINEHRYEAGETDYNAYTLASHNRSLTMTQCLEEWMSEKREQHLKPETYRMYDSRIRQHILPVFGEMYVRTITNEQLKNFFRTTMPDKGMKHDTIRQTFIIIKSAFDCYVRDSKIVANPMVGLKMPPKKKRTLEEHAEMRRMSKFIHPYLLEEARKFDSEARWMLGLLGLRQAEVLGLTDDCFKTSHEPKMYKVVIKQQLQRVPATHGCGPWVVKTNAYPCGKQANLCPDIATQLSWVLKDTKSEAGVREVPLHEDVWKIIQAHLVKQRELRESSKFEPFVTGDTDQDKRFATLLFTRANGQPLAAQTDRRELGKMIKEIGRVEKLRVHDLRHIITTTLLDMDADREDVINVLGWSPKNADAQIATYSHTDRARDAEPMMDEYVKVFKKPAITLKREKEKARLQAESNEPNDD